MGYAPLPGATPPSLETPRAPLLVRVEELLWTNGRDYGIRWREIQASALARAERARCPARLRGPDILHLRTGTYLPMLTIRSMPAWFPAVAYTLCCRAPPGLELRVGDHLALG